jgi:lysophospholipase L1-like esterase
VQPNYRWINYRIAVLNAALRYWAPEWGIPLLDLNTLLSGKSEQLDRRLANDGDGVHLTAPAYRIWGQSVKELLTSCGI